MTLLELAEQYKADVETRIQILTEERDNLYPVDLTSPRQEGVSDYNNQLDHWNTTLKMIRATIEENS